MRFRNRKKKEKKTVTLWLEKNGETMELTMKTGSAMSMLKIAKKAASLGKQGWQLQNVTGSDEKTVGMINGVLSGYKTGDPVPIKKMVKAAGISAVPAPIKRLLKKEEKDQESS